MNFNLTTFLNFKLQLTVGYYDKYNKEFTAIGLNIVKDIQ